MNTTLLCMALVGLIVLAGVIFVLTYRLLNLAVHGLRSLVLSVFRARKAKQAEEPQATPAPAYSSNDAALRSVMQSSAKLDKLEY